MRRTYDPAHILEMAVKKRGVDPNADMDGDALITAADARLALRGETKPAGGGYAYAPDQTLENSRVSLLGRLAQSAAADFPINTDRLYGQYRALYERSAQAAAENAYGLSSAATGGYGNSWASSAAAAAYNGVMEGYADRALEIENLGLRQRQNALQELTGALDAVNEADRTAYTRYRDRVDLAFNAAKQGDYGLLEDLDIDTSALRRGDITALAELAAKYGDNSYLRAMGVDTAALESKNEMERAVAAARYGDYSYLNALGVDTGSLRYNDLLDTAAKLARYGDYSGLEALGVDVAGLREKELLEKAALLAQYGDYALLGSLSQNLANLKQKVSVTVQKGAEDAYYYGGYGALVKYLDKQVGYGQLNEAGKRQILAVLAGR